MVAPTWVSDGFRPVIIVGSIRACSAAVVEDATAAQSITCDERVLAAVHIGVRYGLVGLIKLRACKGEASSWSGSIRVV